MGIGYGISADEAAGMAVPRDLICGGQVSGEQDRTAIYEPDRPGVYKNEGMIFKLIASLIMLLPGAFLWLDSFFHEEEGTSLIFPEAYSPLFLTLMVMHVLAYLYSIYRKQMGGPTMVLLVNLLMVVGIVQNVLIAMRLGVWNVFQLCFILPVTLMVFAMIRNYVMAEGD